MTTATSNKPITVLVSGAGGQIGYALLPLICTGQMFGPKQRVILRLYEVPLDFVIAALRGVIMELEDGAYDLVDRIEEHYTNNAEAAFKDVDYAILVGGFPRKKGMLRAALLKKNAPIFQAVGENLEKYASSNVKVLVVANPANTNCLICANSAPSIPKKNFAALTRLDFNRARAQIARKAKVAVSKVKNVIIWGNHSKTQVPDVTDVLVEGKAMEFEKEWLSEFRSTVQQRGKAIIDARKFSSAMSAANAIKDCIYDWHNGTKPGEHVAMAVWSDKNPYGVADGLFFSFPVTCKNGEWSIVNGIKIKEEKLRALIKETTKELQDESAEFEAISEEAKK